MRYAEYRRAKSIAGESLEVGGVRMAEIFVSYAREDRARVAPLVAALEAQGWSVWWDRAISPGQEFDRLIDRQLAEARAVIVVWTPASVDSRWVRGEAREAADRGVLVPVRFDDARLPLDARAMHTTDFDRWNEDRNCAEFQELCRAIEALLQRQDGARPVSSPNPSVTPSTGRVPIGAYVATAVVAATVGAGIIWFLSRDTAGDWLRETAIPQIETAIDAGDWETAYTLTTQAEARVPASPELSDLWKRFSWRADIATAPAGARVLRRGYDAPEDRWEDLGTTPIEDRRIPQGMSRLRFEREGYVTIERLIGSGIQLGDELPSPGQVDLAFGNIPGTITLDTPSTLPADKVRVPGWVEVIGGEQLSFNDFFLDRTEVTNARFKAFVEAGGYRDPSYWEPIVRDEQAIPFEQAMAMFVDTTGRPGPSTWEAGDYPEGEADFPVSGVSWYEASAYARFMRQELPTAYHLRRALDGASMRWQLPAANLEGSAPRAVGESQSMSYVGALDLAGNVREWAANEHGGGRVILGGSYNDTRNVAMSRDLSAPALDRSPGNGFRLAIIRDEPRVADRAREPLVPLLPQTSWPEPVSDELFAAYSRAFAYARTALNARVEHSETTRLWTRERITFDAAYGGERMMLYLYLPTNGVAPYQTVVYWPGSNAALYTSMEKFGVPLDYVLKSGRAVAFPVLKGMLERGNGQTVNRIAEPIAYRDLTLEQVKDLRRSIDYLETRSDVDPKSVAYFGHSWGGTSGPAVLSHEPRFRAAILYLGFISPALEPEIDSINALPRVNLPALLLNGEFDSVPLANTQHFFALLGTPAADKKHVIAQGGHFVRQDVLVRETLDWLDTYLGQPRVLRRDGALSGEGG
jgi:eukaryotic-like serine/threonine-protein kinase